MDILTLVSLGLGALGLFVGVPALLLAVRAEAQGQRKGTTSAGRSPSARTAICRCTIADGARPIGLSSMWRLVKASSSLLDPQGTSRRVMSGRRKSESTFSAASAPCSLPTFGSNGRPHLGRLACSATQPRERRPTSRPSLYPRTHHLARCGMSARRGSRSSPVTVNRSSRHRAIGHSRVVPGDLRLSVTIGAAVAAMSKSSRICGKA